MHLLKAFCDLLINTEEKREEQEQLTLVTLMLENCCTRKEQCNVDQRDEHVLRSSDRRENEFQHNKSY